MTTGQSGDLRVTKRSAVPLAALTRAGITVDLSGL